MKILQHTFVPCSMLTLKFEYLHFFYLQMSSSSHVQELLLEKEKVNEVRNTEFITFDGVFVCLHKTGNAN